MPDPAARLERARREAVRFARDVRRLTRRHRSGLGEAQEALLAGASEVEAAAQAGEADRLSRALQELDRLWETHLSPRRKRLWRALLEAAALAALAALLVRGFVLDTVRVRSTSMEPTLLPGDVLLVQKAAYALRLPFTHVRLREVAAPRRGDLVALEDPQRPGRVLVRRVAGVPGDVLELREGVLLVNGVPQPRSPLGDYALAPEAGEGEAQATICRRFHEALAKGILTPPQEREDGDDSPARWDAAAGAGIAGFDVLQCRRSGAPAREGPFEAVLADHLFVLGDNRDRAADSRPPGGGQVPYGHLRGRVDRILASFGEGGWTPHGEGGLRLERLFKDVAPR